MVHSTQSLRNLFAVLALLAAATTAQAETITLQEGESVTLDQLLGPDGESLLIGDKLFDGFTLNTAPVGAPPAPSDINVIALVADDGTFGIRFQSLFADLPGGSFADFLLGFDVTAIDPLQLIAGVSLGANPRLVGPGLAEISETITTTEGPTAVGLGSLQVFDPAGPAPPVITDSITFAEPQRSISVEKDIALFAAGDDGSSATISRIDQFFPQLRIPEPGGFSLFAAALAWLTAGARIRSCG